MEGKSKGTARRRSPTRSVPFEYFAPAARVVTLTGDFNQWNPKAKPMRRNAGGLWKLTLRLAPGVYQYKFLVDGERWDEDPLNVHRALNEHGTFNSIRVVD